MGKVVSVILARGGSKGIPGKNIVDVAGYPLIWYSISASLNSNASETFVSTDDGEIKNAAFCAGAKIIDRPKELSTDESPSEEALLHFANKEDFDILLFIQPTSPLIKTEYINTGIEMMNSGKYDSVFTAYKGGWEAIWNNQIEPVGWSITSRPRRQDVEDCWVEDGMFYMTKRENLLNSRLRYSGKMGIVEIKRSDSFEIDTQEDLEMIKEIIKCRRG